MRLKCGAHFARMRSPSARPTGIDHGSSNLPAAAAPTPWTFARYVRIRSYAPASMSVRSRPRPVRTRKKKFRAFAPSSFARSTIAGISPTFQSVTDMCSEKSRPASVSTRVARTAPSQATRRWRNASCLARSVKSRLIEAPRTPRSRMSVASRSRNNTPLVPRTVVKRRSAA